MHVHKNSIVMKSVYTTMNSTNKKLQKKNLKIYILFKYEHYLFWIGLRATGLNRKKLTSEFSFLCLLLLDYGFVRLFRIQILIHVSFFDFCSHLTFTYYTEKIQMFFFLRSPLIYSFVSFRCSLHWCFTLIIFLHAKNYIQFRRSNIDILGGFHCTMNVTRFD